MTSLRSYLDSQPQLEWLKRKLQLMTPWRKEIIQEHRNALRSRRSSTQEIDKERQDLVDLYTALIKPYLPEPEFLGSSILKPILFGEMGLQADFVYTGRKIELTSIEPPVEFPNVLCMIVEDADGDAQKCNVYDFKSLGKSVEEFFDVGCKFSVCHPYFRYGSLDNKPCLRVKNPQTVEFHPEKRLTLICGYCSKPNATKRCSLCHTACYCDKFCQKNDWKVMQHKYICCDQSDN